MNIEKITNGYLLIDRIGGREFYPDCQSLFNSILMKLEGRSIWFGGESFGQVFVASKPEETFQANKEVEPA